MPAQTRSRFVAKGMRCMVQIAMLGLWSRVRGEAPLPSVTSLNASDFERAADAISFCDVENTSAGARYLIRFMGPTLVNAHGKNEVGRYVDEVTPPNFRSIILDGYNYVVKHREPHFECLRVRKDDGPVINYERLLLPFADSGMQVSRILVCVDFFSEANGFNTSDALTGDLVG